MSYITLTVEIDIAAPGPSLPVSDAKALWSHWETRLRRELEPGLEPQRATGIRVVDLQVRHLVQESSA